MCYAIDYTQCQMFIFLLKTNQYAFQLDQSLEAKYMESHGPYHILAILTPPPTLQAP